MPDPGSAAASGDSGPTAAYLAVVEALAASATGPVPLPAFQDSLAAAGIPRPPDVIAVLQQRGYIRIDHADACVHPGPSLLNLARRLHAPGPGRRNDGPDAYPAITL